VLLSEGHQFLGKPARLCTGAAWISSVSCSLDLAIVTSSPPQLIGNNLALRVHSAKAAPMTTPIAIPVASFFTAAFQTKPLGHIWRLFTDAACPGREPI